MTERVSQEDERTIRIDRFDFKVRGRTMPGADLYALPTPPLDPSRRDLFQEAPAGVPDSWIDPRQVVDFDQGNVFFSVPRHINASSGRQP